MKKIFLASIALFFFGNMVQAQNLQDAKKAFNVYKLNTDNKQKLKEAVQSILQDPVGDELTGAAFYLTRGEIFNTVAAEILSVKQNRTGSLDELPKLDLPALKAFDAFSLALKKAKESNPQNTTEIKDALKGLKAVQSSLTNFGGIAYKVASYTDAYNNFATMVKAHDLLRQNGQASMLDDATSFESIQYAMGLAALNAGLSDKAKLIFEKLYEKGTSTADVYVTLYTLYADKDITTAYRYLDAGRKKFPNETSLLFVEINHFLKINKPEEAIEKLKIAITREPNNISLYAALGNINDNLYQNARGTGDQKKANEYFSNALQYYNLVLEKDPKQVEALYSIGALYFNSAVYKTNELNNFVEDNSSEGIKKYENKKKEVSGEFEKALPYFKKAEHNDPNNIGTLTALKEIFAIKDDTVTYNEFKNRLEKIKQGGKNDNPFF